MADNFNLRSFLSENKLTKNAKLLNENVDIAQAFSQAGITGEVTVAFHSSHGMSDEPEFQVMNAQDALAMITSQALLDEEEDVLIAQGDEIDQQGDFDPETQGLECKLEVAILDYGTYEVYQGSNKEGEEDNLDEASYSDSYDTPAAKKVHGQLSSIVDIFSKSRSEEQQELDAAIEAAEQETGTQVTPTERSVLSQQLNWIRTQDMEMEREGTQNKKPIMKETNLTAKERRLVEMVQDALGMTNNDEDQEFDPGQDIEQAQHDIERQYEGEESIEEAKPLPKYNSIEELMKEIEHGTNEAAHKYKMDEMKRVYEALEAKVGSLEEGEHAEHIDQKAVKQMRKDIAALRKAEEKLRKEFDKKFSGKEKKETPVKEKAVEALQEGTFDLRKFLAENRK